MTNIGAMWKKKKHWKNVSKKNHNQKTNVSENLISWELHDALIFRCRQSVKSWILDFGTLLYSTFYKEWMTNLLLEKFDKMYLA